MKKTLAILTATLLTSTTAFAAPLMGDAAANDDTMIMAQLETESPRGPADEEEDAMGETTPDGEGIQVEEDDDGETQAGPVAEDEEVNGDADAEAPGEGIQVEEDDDGETQDGPVAE